MRVGSVTRSADALDTIERIVPPASRQDVASLVALLAHPDYEVRMRSAEALGSSRRSKRAVAALLLTLDQDVDELVRAEAADSLGAIGDSRAARGLKRALGDRSRLVRMYAASSLGEVGNRRDCAVIRNRLYIERRADVRVGLLTALHMLGDDAALARMLKSIDHPDYHVRCVVANAISSLRLRGHDRVVARQALRDAAAKETTSAAASAIAGALRRVERRRLAHRSMRTSGTSKRST